MVTGKSIFRMFSVLFLFVFLLTGALPLQPVQAGHAPSVFPQLTFDCTSVSEIPQEECIALLAFYNSTGGAGWTNNSGWLNSNTPCSWYGLTCGNSTNVTILSFSSNNLMGSIPIEIGNLTSLQELSLNGNQLTGNVPAEISNLSLITNLDIGYNMLTVSDPALLSYLNTQDPDWAATQTIPPSNVQVVFTTSTSIELSWAAIPYISDGGYYEVGWATNIAGPYTIHGMTSNKSASGYVLNNMSPGENYYIRVRTYTPMHAMQQNDLWSEYTSPISASAINPVPVLTTILPDHKNAGDGGFDLILEGSNFTSDAKTLWNGVELVTSFSTSDRVSAAVPSLLLQSPGVVEVTVRNPAPGGGTSNTISFNVNPYTNSWMAHSPEGGVINDIGVDSQNPLVMYAATEVAGVYKSVDGGQNWFAVNNGINAAGPLSDIVVSPSNSSIIVASGAETFISRNGGASWVDLLYNGNGSTNCIRLDAQDPNIITLGTSHGLLQTKDGGSTWQDIGKFPGHHIIAIEVDPLNPGTIYEIDIDPDIINNFTVWKTTDGGISWVKLMGLPLTVGHLKVDPSNSSILYAATLSYSDTDSGIYKSVNGGTTWTRVVSDIMRYGSIVIDSNDSKQVYVASDTGVYRTNDGGVNWEFNAPQKSRDVLALAIAESNPSVLFGAGFHGVFKSLDSGVTWSPINTGLYAHQIVDLAYSTDSNTLFAATTQGGVWRSPDYGASWSHIDQDMPFLRLLRMDPKNNNHLFVSNGGFQESIDGGQTWAPRYFAIGVGLFTFAANSDLLAVTSDGPYGPEHIYKSVDNGATWEKKSDLPICADLCRIYLLVADPLDPNTLYASGGAITPMGVSRDYLYKTIDGGETWVESDNGAESGSYMAIAIDPTNTSILYLGTSWGIYKSVNGGVDWIKVNNYGNSFAMAVDPTNSQTVYAGGIGVYRSLDGGATWTDFNYGLNTSVVWTILPLPAPLTPQVAGIQRNALDVGQVGSVNRVYSIAGGQVYAYFMADARVISTGGDTTGVFRPSNGLLYLKNANTTGFADVAINYGTGGDYPIAGDWDGNGTATIGIYRNGSFYLRNSNTLGFADIIFAFGTQGDQPIAGDWDGDGVDTIGVYSNGQFLLRNSNSAGIADMSFYLGNPGDVGIAGDWNGDGMDTTGVFRPSNGIIFLKNANTTGFADVALNYGLSGDMPVTGDWNNDGTDTIGVYRNAQFLLRNSNTIGFAEIVFGLGNPGDMPIAGNWDGIP